MYYSAHTQYLQITHTLYSSFITLFSSFFLFHSIFSFFFHFHPDLFFVLLYSFSTRPFLFPLVFIFIHFLFLLSSYTYFPPFPFLCPLSYNSFAIFLLCLILCTNLSSFLPSYFSLLFY